MAAGDTALWLHNKLGSTDDLWSGKTICSQLNQNKLQNIQSCYHTLQPHVKVKLMLSFLHLPRRNVEQVYIYFSDCKLLLYETGTAMNACESENYLADCKLLYYVITLIASLHKKTLSIVQHISSISCHKKNVVKGGRRTLKKKESQLKISFVILNR